YVRKEFAATAERRGRPTRIAEAMVDPAVEIPGLSEKGKLLTLTTAEGVEHGVVDFRAENVQEVLGHFALGAARVREVAPAMAERLVRFITSPALASILMTVGMLGILVELRTPGFGVPGVLGLLCLGLFFWGHWLARLAGLEELALIALGILLLAAELFIPGFGVAGVLGVLALALGLGLSLVGAGVTAPAIFSGLGQALLSLLVVALALLVVFKYLPHAPFARGVVLDTALASEARARPEPRSLSRVGQRGVSLSPLRPAGIAELDGERVDVVTEGEFVDMGEPVEVVQHEGNRVVVRRAKSGTANKE
ncbi:MAG TPA: NfeD family protein, partial [Polyangiaceae bacterium]